jgi:threonylcarbamoyladenosine tRNA methylthiotransferase MtaB
LNKDKLSKEDEDLILLGNADKFSLPEIILTGKLHAKTDRNAFIPSWSSGDRTRTFFKIQDGCDYYCSYCTIPYARGNSRSGSLADTLSSIREATKNGCNELVLSGVNIGDFGRYQGETLYELLDALQYFDNIHRIRLSSIEPDLLHNNIIELFASSKIFMPHFHVPLQAGSDEILKLMNRKYDTELYASKLKTIREKIPYACIATDIITGFPGEDENDFKEGYKFLESLDISYMHVFTYSERSSTKAAEMTSPVDPEVKKYRSMKLHRLSEFKKNRFYENHYGRICDALFESETQDGHLIGFTDNYIRVKTKFDETLKNTIRTVKILQTDHDGVCWTELL